MKHYKWLITGTIILILPILLVGCVAKSDYEALQAEHETLQASYETLQGEIASQETRLKTIQADLANLQINYSDLEAENKALTDFPTLSFLRDWVQDHLQPETVYADDWYISALEVQREAAEDGYLVSACIEDRSGEGTDFLVYNMAMAGGSLFWWDPGNEGFYGTPGEVYPYPLGIYR